MKKCYLIISNIGQPIGLDSHKVTDLAKKASDGHWYIFFDGHTRKGETDYLRTRCILIRSDFQSANEITKKIEESKLYSKFWEEHNSKKSKT